MHDRSAALLQELRQLYDTQAALLRAEHQRSVPFGELVSDRWARARSLGFGEGASIYDSALVIGEVSVGERTWIGPHTVLDGSGGLTIGATCSISSGVQLYTHDSVAWALSGGRAEYVRAPVHIGDHCYIGPLSVIAKGVTIGAHCLVAANSVVTRSVKPFSIVGGSPARVIGRVELTANGEVTLHYGEGPSSAGEALSD
jgi:acetyltransferase-like isoleucine patch superfamily enzyme